MARKAWQLLMPRPAPDPKVAAERKERLAVIAASFGGWTNAANVFASFGHDIRPDNIKRDIERSDRCPGDNLMAVAERAAVEVPRWTIGKSDKGGRWLTHLLHPLFTAPIVNGTLDEDGVRWLGDRGKNFRAALADAKAYLKGL